MTTKKLTKTVVDAAEPTAGRYMVFDDEIKGFALRVFPSGAKSWVFEYKPWPGGRKVPTKRYTIGDATKVTAVIARTEAKRLQSMVNLRQDPQGEKQAERVAIEEAQKAETVKDLASAFLKAKAAGKHPLKPGTIEHYRDILERLVIPDLGKVKARDLSKAQVKKLFQKISDATPFQANRTLAVISSMFRWAMAEDILPEGPSPVRGIGKNQEKSRGDKFQDEELARLGAAIREAETVGIPWEIDPEKQSKHMQKADRVTRIGPHAAAAIRLLTFTGCRLREILHLKWEDVDFKLGVITLKNHKSSRLQGDRPVVLNGPALQVLEKLPRLGVYVIAGASAGEDGEKPRSDLKKPWALVTKRAGLEGRRIHDLRHNYASFGAGAGMGLQIVGKLLGHRQSSTTERYSHFDDNPQRRASNTIATTIAHQMGEQPAGAKPKKNNVLPLPKRAG